MARYISRTVTITPTRKCTSQGKGGRGRRVKVGMSTMNKHKKRSHKKYRGQGKCCLLYTSDAADE